MPETVKRLAAWLGLINDDAYDYPADEVDTELAQAEANDVEATITPLTPRHTQTDGAAPAHAEIASVEPLVRPQLSPQVIRAFSFNDAEQVGRRYRAGYPVVLDLSLVSTVEGKRLLDFVSGVVFVSDGKLEKLRNRTFLLSPQGVYVSADIRANLVGDLSKSA